MPKLTKKLPAYSLHKASGQAVMKIGGQSHYLGVHGSEASHQEYDRLCSEYLAAGRSAAVMNSRQSDLTVKLLALAFWKERKTYYVKDGKPTSEKAAWQAVLKKLNRLYGNTAAEEFGPTRLKAVREAWVDQGLSRSVVNRNVRKVVELFRWGVESEIVETETWQKLTAVRGLKKGRTPAREPTPVAPVEMHIVELTMPHLSPVVRDMIRVQLLTGARPGEVCKLRPMDVDRSGEVWVYIPASHKTEHHGRSRKLYLGPEAQAVLRPYLLRGADACCFSAIDSREWFRDVAAGRRVTPPSCGNARGRKNDPRDGARSHMPRPYFDTQTYGKSIRRATKKAWPVPDELREIADTAERRVAIKQWEDRHAWAPNQLRHTRATDVRARYGLEAAQVILGHATADVTQIYAERDDALARRVAKESG